MRIAPDPQLAVCKGLLEDRFQKLKAGMSVMSQKLWRESWGTLSKVQYDPYNSEHKGRPKHKDALDGVTYVHDVVEWFIRKVSALAGLDR